MSAPEPTLAKRSPEMIRATLQRIDSFLRTTPIPRGGPVAAWEPAPSALSGLAVSPTDGAIADVLASTETDGWLVVHDGRVLIEEYIAPMSPTTRHLLMSVSKSIVGVVAGALVDRGILDPARPCRRTCLISREAGTPAPPSATSWTCAPASGSTRTTSTQRPRCGCSTRPSAGRRTPAADRARSRSSSEAWSPRGHTAARSTTAAATPTLGWICEAAAGAPLAALISELVWSRIGAEGDASLCLDAEGAAMCDGGISATLRDLACFGATILGGGVARTASGW